MPTPSTRRNANRARCQFADCDKFAQTRGLCKAHGGGSRCRDPQCNKLAQSRGLCIAHGGGRRCQFEACKKLAQSKGYCISHGGGRRCTIPNCEKFSQVKGRCKSHSKLLAAAKHPLSPAHEAVTTPSSSINSSPKSAMSPTNTKLSIDFLVNPLQSRSSSSDKQPMQTRAPIQTPAFSSLLRSTPKLANPFTATVTSNSRWLETNVLGNQRSLLSFLEPAATSSFATPRSLYPPIKAEAFSMPGHYQAPILPSLALYR
ncbi:hypothetical protein BBJ28_00002596 [Nothophytophthora sp. Chile5]|nr:hypothetical protein BBJ28_00002596 [Nothophytophthora sp. Chile5]